MTRFFFSRGSRTQMTDCLYRQKFMEYRDDCYEVARCLSNEGWKRDSKYFVYDGQGFYQSVEPVDGAVFVKAGSLIGDFGND